MEDLKEGGAGGEKWNEGVVYHFSQEGMGGRETNGQDASTSAICSYQLVLFSLLFYSSSFSSYSPLDTSLQGVHTKTNRDR